MSTTKFIFGKIIRWIFIIPLAATIYAISKLCLSWTFDYISSNLVKDINSMSDFGGHYILGPIFIFLKEGFAIGFAVYSGVYLAPNHKKSIFFSFIFLWILLLLFISFSLGINYFKFELTNEMIFRNITELVAQLIGFIVAGIYIWKEQKTIEEQNYTDFDLLV